MVVVSFLKAFNGLGVFADGIFSSSLFSILSLRFPFKEVR